MEFLGYSVSRTCVCSIFASHVTTVLSHRCFFQLLHRLDLGLQGPSSHSEKGSAGWIAVKVEVHTVVLEGDCVADVLVR